MKVLLNGMLLGGYFSGVEVSISSLAHACRQFGRHSYHFVSPSHAGFTGETSDRFTLHTIPLPMKSRLCRVAWEHLRLDRMCRRLGCDVLHCPGYITPYFTSVPTVLTVHDCFSLLNPEWCKVCNRLYYELTFKRSLERAARIIVPSSHVKEQLITRFCLPEKKISRIPFACAPVFKPTQDNNELAEVKKRYKLPDHYFLFVGNTEPKKNLPAILRAFSEFRKQDEMARHYRLVIVGKESWGVRLSEMVKLLDVRNFVHHTGYVKLADLPAIYSGAESLLFLSLSEGFGIPVLEAMACGTPVIASDRGALPETVGDAGICLDPNNVKIIVDTMNKLSRLREYRQSVVDKGIAHAKQFSWEKTVHQTEKVYESLQTTAD